MMGVYKITNKTNGKIYIGVSTDIENRWNVHRRIYDKVGDKEYEKTLYKAFRKYGLDSFEFEIIEECEDKDIMFEREKYWIKELNAKINGYNESYGGKAGSEKGHCAGSTNGRSKLVEEDIINIRRAYAEHKLAREIYPLFQDKITKSSFMGVWNGSSWKHVMMDVYTLENKEWHKKNGAVHYGDKNSQSIFTETQVKEIRTRRANMENKNVVRQDYLFASKIAFEQIWYNMTWKHIIITKEE